MDNDRALGRIPIRVIDQSWLAQTTLAEGDSLGQRKVVAPVDRRRLPAHVELPRVRARFAPAAGLLFPSEGAADLGPRRADVDVGDPAVGPDGREEPLGRREATR